MKVDEKYLPTVTERKEFIRNRMFENKKMVYGGVLETLMATANGEARTVKTTEDQMEQIIKNLDIYQAELDKLGN